MGNIWVLSGFASFELFVPEYGPRIGDCALFRWAVVACGERVCRAGSIILYIMNTWWDWRQYPYSTAIC